MKKAAHWTVIHMTHGQKQADIILEVLSSEGFMAKTRQMSRSMTGDENDFEILCLASEAQEAHQLLIERGLLM